ncbi:hypothetical protein [Brachybacterium sp. YJGR34]|uniref:hypothetical protein n=1 Tax=Brachybacterium sp. YJGR34 TaxID=2059911 RepID=UPI000E0C4875|nr:hypothetical protein [Brachybacterium sp. YJGR34]
MALIHPRSLERWQHWQNSRHRPRQVKQAVAGAVRSRRGGEEPGADLVLHAREGEGPRLLVALDTATPTSRAALLTALPYLRIGVDVLAPAGLAPPELAGAEWEREDVEDLPATLDGRGITSVISAGWHLRVGRRVHDWAHEADVAAAVVQHGALTPYAPPLPPDTTLLAWSDADAAFYRSGREDVVTRTVGSQLLWQAAHDAAGPEDDGRPVVEPGAGPVFLGQMHGAELPRRTSARTAYRFCREQGAQYRPHPAETDALSRAAHALMRRRGITLADPALPLRDLRAPVVGIFSTGVLEAAVRGLPAYVYGPSVPAWVHELWDRYDLRRWGGDPTPAPAMRPDEPARLLAQILEGAS